MTKVMGGIGRQEGANRGTILLLEDDESLAEIVALYLRDAGYDVMHAEDGGRGLELLRFGLPDLIISDVMMPRMDGLSFLRTLRADPLLRGLPVILLTTKSRVEDIVSGFDLGADDYLVKPFDPAELVARANAKILRPPVPAEEVRRDRDSGLLGEAAFREELDRELRRAQRGGYEGAVAVLNVDELERLRRYLGPQTDRAIATQLGRLIGTSGDPLASFGRRADGSFLLVLPGLDLREASSGLNRLSQAVAAERFMVGNERVRLTPSIGFALFGDAKSGRDLIECAELAAGHAELHLDLRPSRYVVEMREAQAAKNRLPARLAAWLDRFRLPLQMLSTLAIAWLIPFGIYMGMGALGADISGIVYIVMVVMIVATAILIWVEGILAMRRVDPPPASNYPPASAIIAAYLPNEAATLESTIEAFLRVDYPGDLQIILAYNTPHDMPFEAVLQDIARRDQRFVPLRVQTSTSKAQNVNAVLGIVDGDFVGVFDADHQPDPTSFCRAWDWLASGFDIVQGHCFIRNGDVSWVARTVAIEFEQIYAVSHPGRSRLHKFGIFGGSNGYWKAETLRSIRMHGSMLTEDIDSSLRVIERGGKIASDPHLISRELAPTDLKGLTNQRLRWAQGWFQVSLKRLIPMLRSRHLTLRQKFGAFHLLAWREVFPWISLQIFPIVAFWAYQAGGLSRIEWFVPVLFFLTIATLATGPGQIMFTWILAEPEQKKRPLWFLSYFGISMLFYSEFKNLLARVGQIKEFLGEKSWKVTPR